MRLFALEDGRARPVRPDSTERPWDERTASDVRETVLDLVGTPLLPLLWQVDDVLGEHLLALDSTGAAVLVVVRERVDAEVLVTALHRYAELRRASWREVAAWYQSGPETLRRDWAAFRESIPARVEPSPGVHVLAGEVAPGVRGAADVLDAGTVEIHEIRPNDDGGHRTLAMETIGARLAVRPVLLELQAQEVEETLVLVSVAAAGEAEEPAPAATEAPAEPTAPDAVVREEDVPTPAIGTRRRERHAAPASPHSAAEDLIAVAGLVGESELTLEGSSGEVRGVLTAQASIVVAGGTYTDPALAAAAVVGAPVRDGWAAWRFGVDGPFLGEALEEARNPNRRTARPSRRRAVRR